jgi:hypothetical protein
LHGDERRGGLHHFPKRHRSGDVLGSAEEERDDRCQTVRGIPTIVVRIDCIITAASGCGRPAAESTGALGIAAEQCDAFGVLAQTGQGIPVIGFSLTSALSQRTKRGDFHHGAAGQHRAGKRGSPRTPDAGIMVPIGW